MSVVIDLNDFQFVLPWVLLASADTCVELSASVNGWFPLAWNSTFSRVRKVRTIKRELTLIKLEFAS